MCAPGEPEFGPTLDGFLEGANVDLANELLATSAAARGFNFSLQAFQSGKQELQNVLELARQV